MISALLLSAFNAMSSGWNFVDAPPGDHPVTVHSVGDRLVAIDIGQPRVSDDGGKTWRTSAMGMPTNILCGVSDEEDGVLLAYCSGKFYRSTDRADTWQDWSAGFTTDVDLSPYYGLALGDTTAVFVAGFETESRIWVRHGSGPWKRSQRLGYTQTDLIWTGRAFLLGGGYIDGEDAVHRSEDGVSWESQDLETYLQSLATRNDTTWLLVGDTLRTSLDHGKSWLPRKHAIPARQIVVSKRGFYGHRNDSIHSIDPRTGSARLILVQENAWLQSAYSSPNQEILNLWSNSSLVSDESMRTWAFQRRPEAGLHADAFTRHEGSWFVDAVDFWSRRNGAPWASTDSIWARSFRTHEGTLYAGSYQLRTHRSGVWRRDSLSPPNRAYSNGILRWIEGLGIPAMTDGDFVWLRPPGATTWRRLEREVALGSTASTAVGFDGRIWFARHTFSKYLDECLFSFDTATGELTSHEIPHYEGAYGIAVSGKTMWVATDLGLMRSDDTGRSFQEAGLPAPWNGFAAADLLVVGDTIVATMQTMAMRVLDCPERATWLSFDNGGTWTRDADTSLVASAFFADSTGLYAFMQGRGIHRWQASNSTQSASPRTLPPRTFTVRRSAGTWLVVGTPGDTIEVRDTSGKLVASTILDTRGISGALDLPSGVHHLSATSPGSGSLSIVVP